MQGKGAKAFLFVQAWGNIQAPDHSQKPCSYISTRNTIPVLLRNSYLSSPFPHRRTKSHMLCSSARFGSAIKKKKHQTWEECQQNSPKQCVILVSSPAAHNPNNLFGQGFIVGQCYFSSIHSILGSLKDTNIPYKLYIRIYRIRLCKIGCLCRNLMLADHSISQGHQVAFHTKHGQSNFQMLSASKVCPTSLGQFSNKQFTCLIAGIKTPD